MTTPQLVAFDPNALVTYATALRDNSPSLIVNAGGTQISVSVCSPNQTPLVMVWGTYEAGYWRVTIRIPEQRLESEQATAEFGNAVACATRIRTEMHRLFNRA